MTHARLTTRWLYLALAVLGAALALALLGRGLAAAAPAAAGVTVTPPGATQASLPGAAVTYTLRVTNTGDLTDILTLTVAGQVWTTDIFVVPSTIIITNTQVLILLNPGEGRSVNVQVSVPLTATGQDVTTFSAVSGNDPGIQDTAILTTTTGGRTLLPIILKDAP